MDEDYPILEKNECVLKAFCLDWFGFGQREKIRAAVKKSMAARGIESIDIKKKETHPPPESEESQTVTVDEESETSSRSRTRTDSPELTDPQPEFNVDESDGDEKSGEEFFFEN